MKYKGQLGVLGVLVIVFGGVAIADSDGDEGRSHRQAKGAVLDSSYVKECGSCHTAFPPSFLPAASWVRIMSGLDKHFGDNAELPPAQQESAARYLDQNAADKISIPRGARVMKGLDVSNPPLRLTETDYFRRLHHEISPSVFKKSPQLKNFSNCSGCHPGADKAIFAEEEVRIPGVGSWD